MRKGPLLLLLMMMMSGWADRMYWCRNNQNHVKYTKTSTGGLLCYTITDLLRSLLAIHNAFCWWIKVEEAKYVAQIYAESLTLRASHPWAKSPFPVTSAEKREEVTQGKLSEGRGAERWQGEREEGIWALSLSNNLHSGEEREGTWEGGREGGRLSLHSSKLHWVTHPLLQPWPHATII